MLYMQFDPLKTTLLGMKPLNRETSLRKTEATAGLAGLQVGLTLLQLVSQCLDLLFMRGQPRGNDFGCI